MSPLADHRAVPVDGTLQQTLDGSRLPAPTNKIRLSTPDSARPIAHPQQPTGGHRHVGTLDLDQLSVAECCGATNKSRSGRAEHHTTGRGHRLHPLGHTDLLTDGGVTQCTRADLTGDHLTGVQPHPQLQLHPVAVTDANGKPLRLLLNA